MFEKYTYEEVYIFESITVSQLHLFIDIFQTFSTNIWITSLKWHLTEH